MPSDLNKHHPRGVEKTKFDLAKAKLDEETRLTMINSKRSLTILTSNYRNKKKKNVRSPVKSLPLPLSLPDFLKERSQRSSKTVSNP